MRQSRARGRTENPDAMLTVLLALCSLCLLWLYFKNKKTFPPGPVGLPFVGNTPLLRKLSQKLKGQHRALSQLASDYKTPVLGLTLGNQPVVVVFTPDLVRDVLVRDEFVGRPDTFFTRLRCFGNRNGITFADGDFWHNQRSFTLKTLRNLGMGKKRMEDLILSQVEELIKEYSKDEGPQSIINVLSPCINRVLWEVAAGTRLSAEDKHLLRLMRILNVRNRAFDMAGGILSQFPWLRYIAPQWSGYSLLTELNKEMSDFLMEAIHEHRRTYQKNQTRDLIDAFLHEMDFSNSENNYFTEQQLLMVLTDLFLGGASSTSTTLDFAFLLMAKYPSVQEKVYQEIHDTLDDDQLPRFADRARLPYTTSVLLEVQRFCTVIPITGPRRTLQDTTLHGYRIPKDTTVLISQWSVHMDESLYSEPEKFCPERFLDSETREKMVENIIPFGLGKRRCLGESLAKPCLFLIFTGIIQTFRIEQPSDEPELSLDPVPGIILTPKPYKVLFKRRN